MAPIVRLKENFYLWKCCIVCKKTMADLKRCVLVLIASCLWLTATAGSFADVRKKATEKGTALGNIKITGIVISDYRSPNMELCPNVRYDQVDLRLNKRTAYIESEDGRYGFRLVFDGIYDNRLKRYDKVELNLNGCVVVREDNPERYTITGLTSDNVVSREAGTRLPMKEKSIGELTDDDVYTYVTLTDVEFASKQRSYNNVNEQITQPTYINEFGKPNAYMDGWASMLEDGDNNSIYMLVNTKCAWRRDGRGVPKGVGRISGIVVHTDMRRYGGDMGRYSIRPVDVDDVIGQMPREESSSYDIIAEWNWNRNYTAALRFEKAGVRKKAMKAKPMLDDRILPDVGVGFLSAGPNMAVRLDTDYDTRYADDNSGMRKYAGARFESKVRDWYLDDAGITVEFSTEGLSGKGLAFDFTFGAGNHDMNNSWGFPVDWKVEYSTDGVHFTPVSDGFVLRALPYADKTCAGVGPRCVSCDTAMGFTEHHVVLPSTLFGQKSVLLRLTPSSRRMAIIPEDPMADSAVGNIPVDSDKNFILRFGMFSVKYLK